MYPTLLLAAIILGSAILLIVQYATRALETSAADDDHEIVEDLAPREAAKAA